MILGLIGMSGVGKTTWAEKFAAAGFACLHCDDLIADKLYARGVVVDTSIAAMGRWMGFPDADHYSEREAQYLAQETEVLRDIAQSLAEQHARKQRLIIDMTGSAVYVAPQILAALRRHATLVYLAATAAQHDNLLRAYLLSPRPVIWNGHYQPAPGEDSTMTLTRCYADLLRERASRYAALAHVTLDPTVHQNPTTSVSDFLHAVETCHATCQR